MNVVVNWIHDNQKLLFYEAVFLGTGVFTTLGNQYVAYNGAGGKESLLISASIYYGMALVNFLPKKVGEKNDGVTSLEGNKVMQKDMLLMTVLDVCGNVCSAVGLVLAGSGLYQTLYSSMVVFSAIVSRIVMKRVLNQLQYVALALLVLGLSLTTTSGLHLGASVFWGALITFLGTALYSLQYVLSERILTQPDPPAPITVCSYIGVYSALVVTVYLGLVTIPQWDRLVVAPIEQANGNVFGIVLMYILLILSSLYHNLSYFNLLSKVGAVATGVLQALRAILVFGFSSLLYCNFNSAQCYTYNKGLATLLVVFGVILYAVAGNAASPNPAKVQSHSSGKTGRGAKKTSNTSPSYTLLAEVESQPEPAYDSEQHTLEPAILTLNDNTVHLREDLVREKDTDLETDKEMRS
eukprot:GCRY01003178.1.p1 GENE.GCRY01003178.1~~GCRY01003178.1.p1  ORF type:complete len:410 (-),score=65.51 GCRY01003178.1:37-1266(-)